MALTREELIAELTEEQLKKSSDIRTFNQLLYQISEKRKTLAANSLSLDEWTKYRDVLKQLNVKAAEEFRDAVWILGGRWNAAGLGYIERDDVIAFAYERIAKYGEGAAEAACEFYDAIAELSGAKVPPAVPAETASLSEVAKAINGVTKVTEDPDMISGVVGRLVKQAGQDTTVQNAIRDGAQVAWVPAGDTCAFCLALASRGWEDVSKKTVKNGHAEHIHANCDCAYAVRFNESFKIGGYNPNKYLRIYNGADGETPNEKINAMRRELYQDNKEKINAQKREAYEERKERESLSQNI